MSRILGIMLACLTGHCHVFTMKQLVTYQSNLTVQFLTSVPLQQTSGTLSVAILTEVYRHLSQSLQPTSGTSH